MATPGDCSRPGTFDFSASTSLLYSESAGSLGSILWRPRVAFDEAASCDEAGSSEGKGNQTEHDHDSRPQQKAFAAFFKFILVSRVV